MRLKLNSLLLLIAFLFISLLSCQASNEIILVCKDKSITVEIVGTKTRLSKLKKILDSEGKIIVQLEEAAALKHIEKILSDTGLFERVSVDSTTSDGKKIIKIKDAYTLLPIVNFSTNLENFSYTIGASESNLFHDYWFISGAMSQSNSSEDFFYNFGVAYPTPYIQNASVGGFQGDNYFYYNEKWYQYDLDDFYMSVQFKKILGTQKFNYGMQFRYTQFDFIDDPTPSVSGFVSLGKNYYNHDISEGYSLSMALRYIDSRYTRYAFNSSLRKKWYVPFRHSNFFRGYLVDFYSSFSSIEAEPKAISSAEILAVRAAPDLDSAIELQRPLNERHQNNLERTVVGTFFSFRNGALHGLRSNSIDDRNFGAMGLRFGITSQKFLWTYWQPHIFMECGLSNHERYYSVGGGLLMTFPALYNSRLRIQYYVGELPDTLSGVIISTSLDF